MPFHHHLASPFRGFGRSLCLGALPREPYLFLSCQHLALCALTYRNLLYGSSFELSNMPQAAATYGAAALILAGLERGLLDVALGYWSDKPVQRSGPFEHVIKVEPCAECAIAICPDPLPEALAVNVTALPTIGTGTAVGLLAGAFWIGLLCGFCCRCVRACRCRNARPKARRTRVSGASSARVKGDRA